MAAIDPDFIEPGDIVTMQDRFIVTEVTDDEIWNDQVAYKKRSQFSSIERTWDRFPIGVEL